MPAALELNENIEDMPLVQKLYTDDLPQEQLVHLIQVFLRQAGNHLQFQIRIAADDACRACRLDTLFTVRVRHGDGFGVFDDVAAHTNPGALYRFAQYATGKRCRIRNRNRFGAAHRRAQLLV